MACIRLARLTSALVFLIVAISLCCHVKCPSPDEAPTQEAQPAWWKCKETILGENVYVDMEACGSCCEDYNNRNAHGCARCECKSQCRRWIFKTEVPAVHKTFVSLPPSYVGHVHTLKKEEVKREKQWDHWNRRKDITVGSKEREIPAALSMYAGSLPRMPSVGQRYHPGRRSYVVIRHDAASKKGEVEPKQQSVTDSGDSGQEPEPFCKCKEKILGMGENVEYEAIIRCCADINPIDGVDRHQCILQCRQWVSQSGKKLVSTPRTYINNVQAVKIS